MSDLRDNEGYSNKQIFSSSTINSRNSLTPSAPPVDAESSFGSNKSMYPKLQPPPSKSFERSVSFITGQNYEVIRPALLPVRDDYARNPKLIGSLNISNQKVMGMTFVDDALYVVRKYSNVLSVYTTTDTQPNWFISPPVSNHSITGLAYPRGLAANLRKKHLFITDRRRRIGTSKGGRLMKVSLDGAVITYVDIDYEPYGVSVGLDNERIIVACGKNVYGVSVPILGAGHIVIFEEINDKLREVQLISLEESLEVPRHAIEAPTVSRPGRGKEYLVVHGWTRLPGLECHHRVSRVNSDGTATATFGKGNGRTEYQLDRPISICLDDSDKMFVVDYFNDRVLLLTRTPSECYDLALVRPLLTKANGLSRPTHVCLEAKKRLVFVGQENGHIQVFFIGPDHQPNRNSVIGQTEIFQSSYPQKDDV